MKKSSIGKKLGIAVALLIFLAIVILLAYRPKPVPVPVFKFLSGHGSYIRIDELKPKLRETRFVYSFKADFKDIVADANSELSALGYSGDATLPVIIGMPVLFGLSGNKPMDGIVVGIFENKVMNVISTPKNSDYKTPPRHVYSWKNGCVSVEVTQSKEVSWFSYGFLRLLNKLYRIYQ
jgi:hypothetical protein